MSADGAASRDRAAATGQSLTEATWLDAHFEACRTGYEAIVRSVGIQPGWHLLDAGCGGGGFLPLLAELVGPTGQVTAIDLAPDNIAAVQERLATWHLPCPITAQSASFTALPFPDEAFDAVWCANVLMYLNDTELTTALAEFHRVIRPGGRLMLKEFDLRMSVSYPGDQTLFWRVWAAQNRGDSPAQGALRSRGLPTALARAGFVEVSKRTVLIEHYAPLSPVVRQYVTENLAYHVESAGALGMSESDIAAWRKQSDPASPSFLVDQPDFYWCEPQIVVVGTVGSGV